jgi:hypothetical protein
MDVYNDSDSSINLKFKITFSTNKEGILGIVETVPNYYPFQILSKATKYFTSTELNDAQTNWIKDITPSNLDPDYEGLGNDAL